MKKFSGVILFFVLIFLMSAAPKVFGQFFFMQDENIGKIAPDFTLRTLSGKDMNFTKVRGGKRAVIFFWATWCPHCREAMSELTSRGDNVFGKDVQLFIVDTGEDAQTVGQYAKNKKISFDILLDSDSKLAEDYALIGVPTFIFINEQGVVKNVEHVIPEDLSKIFG